jgi:hypothetical protein
MNRPFSEWVARSFGGGVVAGELMYPDGTVERRHLGHNVIVQDASLLIAQLCKGEDVPGFTHLAVGVGDPTWDKFDPPPETPDVSKLVSEVVRVAADDIYFVKEDGSGAPSESRTRIVDFVFTFSEAQANAPLVEQGLFGGANASLPNSGTMVNYRTHSVWNKPVGARLSLLWRFTF